MRKPNAIHALAWFALALVVGLIGATQQSCATVKPILRTLDDVARWHCARYYSGVQAVSIEDAWEAYCKTREAWAPWIDPVIRAQQEGVAIASGAELASSASPAASATLEPQCPEPAKPPEPVAPPAPSASAGVEQ